MSPVPISANHFMLYKQKPIYCGMCDETFDYWTKKQWHRNQVHGLDEPLNALPENA